MLLSKKLTFYFVFSVLLVAALAFTIAPAMAQDLTVTAKGAITQDDTATADVNEAKVVVTFTYSVNANPAPVKADFIATTAADLANATVAGTGKVFTLTIPEVTAVPAGLTLTGYVAATIPTAEADDPVTLEVEATYLAGYGYVVIANNDADVTVATNFPTLPVGAGITKRAWYDHDGDTTTTSVDATTGAGGLPNLYDLFQLRGGGTLNLKVLDPADTTKRLGSKQDDGTYSDDHGRNQRQVVINEVMWARDDALVGQATRTQQQWIELRNMRTTPVAYANLVLTTSKDFPAPAAETDRLSNVPAFNNTWSVAGKGQDGNSGGTVTNNVSEFAKVNFISMERVNYDNGWDAGRWESAKEFYLPNYKGTPGAENRPAGVQGPRKVADATNPPKDKVIVNEIGLSDTDGNEWIELHNPSGSAVNIKNWTVSLTTGYGNETVIHRFVNNDNFPGGHHPQSIPAGGHLLLVFKDPSQTPLAVGIDVEKMGPVEPGEPGDQKLGHADHKFVNINGAQKTLPNTQDWLIIIRSNHEDKFLQSSHHIQDVAGPGGNGANFKIQDINKAEVRRNKKGDGNAGGDIWHTAIWPLQNQNHGGDKFLRHTNLDPTDRVWHRRSDKGGGQGWWHESFGHAGFTGVGYDRNYVGEQYSGTPGYPNGTSKGKVGDITDGKVVISELMLTTDDGRFPQWLELHNTSKTNAVNLAADDGWRLIIENHDSGQWEGERNLVSTINFKSKGEVKSIPPNQTILVASNTTRTNSEDEYYPDHRVYSVYENDRKAFFMANRRAPFLNTNGFHIQLVDGKKTVSDEVGNLDGNDRTYDDPYSWNWPTDLTENGERSSLIRLKKDKTPLMATPDRMVDGDMTGQVLPMGTKWRGNGMVGMGMDAEGNPMMVPAKYAGSAWVHASDVRFEKTETYYYGNRDDIGTPAHTAGSPLPVELSHFRPTLENGEVTIRWTTESELNNAGFNILRSDTRDGEFKQVNAEMIQGNGTTGERSTYKWVDETAKPNVVYYYQIEDVSFAGERQTLQTTKLKGLISARGKATTTWGDIKEVQ